jgi:hypothetical protein
MDDSELAHLDANGLCNKYVELVLLEENTDHIGRKNRISGWVHDIGKRLIAIGSESEREAMPLLEHRSEAVRFAAAYLIKPFNRELFVSVLESLARNVFSDIGREARFALSWRKSEDERASRPSGPDPAPDPNWLRILHWQRDNPPPPAMNRGKFEDRLLTEFSADRARQIMALVRPAIGLWEQRNAPTDSHLASRHGGDLFAPPGWQWPIYEQEPMYFLGQIRCRDLGGLPGAELLPREGLLAFFGDFDVIAGCFPGGDTSQGSVFHWAEEGLVPDAAAAAT